MFCSQLHIFRLSFNLISQPGLVIIKVAEVTNDYDIGRKLIVLSLGITNFCIVGLDYIALDNCRLTLH